jgi:thioesterase domain-containing protein
VAHDVAIERYQPAPYAGRVTLFRVKAMSLFRSHDPLMGWSEYAGQGVDVRMISGAHYNILEQPHVADLAAQLRQCLDAAQTDD